MMAAADVEAVRSDHGKRLRCRTKIGLRSGCYAGSWPFAGRDRDLDKVAKRAIDELCRGMVALALGRDADVPTSCAKLRKPLARYAAVVKTMLAK